MSAILSWLSILSINYTSRDPDVTKILLYKPFIRNLRWHYESICDIVTL